MSKMKYINKSSITAAMKAYRLNDDNVAKACGLSYNSFYSIRNHKSNLVKRKSFDALERVFKFNEFGDVESVPFIEKQIAERKRHIKQQEIRRMIKSFLLSLLVCALGFSAIIAFGYKDFTLWILELIGGNSGI